MEAIARRALKLKSVARFFFVAGLAFVGAVSFVENASAATVFTASGVFDDGATLSGTLTIDTVTGSFVSADLFVSGDPKASSASSSQFSLIFSQNESSLGYPTVTYQSMVVIESVDDVNEFDITLDSNLVGYAGGSISLAGIESHATLMGGPSLTSGTLKAAPEPGSLPLAAVSFLGLLPGYYLFGRRKGR